LHFTFTRLKKRKERKKSNVKEEEKASSKASLQYTPSYRHQNIRQQTESPVSAVRLAIDEWQERPCDHFHGLCRERVAHLEVVHESAGVGAKRAREDGLATHRQQNQAVERFKDFDAGLMDGDHDGAAVRRHVAHRINDGCCGPRVQPRGGLVHELHTFTLRSFPLHSSQPTLLTPSFEAVR
jgi:hypothetical protein